MRVVEAGQQTQRERRLDRLRLKIATTGRRWGPHLAVSITIVFVASTFSSLVRADDFGGDPNYALPAFGSVAAASGNTWGNDASKANDANLATMWECDQTTSCWLAIIFSVPRTLDEVQLHMPGGQIAWAVDLYVDTNNNGDFETGERVYQLTGNSQASRRITLPAATGKGVEAKFISMYGGNYKPALLELEIYWRDLDADGLMNGFGAAMRYYQDASFPNVPQPLNWLPAEEDGALGRQQATGDQDYPSRRSRGRSDQELGREYLEDF